MPSRTALITDTDCSLPAGLAQRYNIRQIPIAINFDSQTFLTGIDIDDAACFERIDREGKLPTTSACSIGDFHKAFEAAFAEGAEEILCITVSSKVSAVYAAAVAARDMLPGCKITVLDSLSLSMGQGFMVLAAAEALAGGAGADAAAAQAEELGRRVHLFAALSTLKYLAMSGRVGHLAAAFGGLLDVRPILTIRDGKLDLLERSRTQKKAWARVVELGLESLNGRPVERMAILHVNALEQARQLGAQLRASLQAAGVDVPAEVVEAELTPGLSVHAGSGVVGFTLVASR